MKRTQGKQYTIRNVPPAVDRALRKQARANGKSLNDTALEALRRAVGIEAVAHLDEFRDIIGTWIEDPEFDRAIAAQDTIDPEIWR